MSESHLLDAISCMDSELIENYCLVKERLQRQKKRSRRLTRWISVAACLVLLLVGVPFALWGGGLLPRDKGSIGDYQVSLTDVVYRGQKIEAGESDAYFRLYEYSILSTVSKKENIPVYQLRLSRKGFYHVTVSEKKNSVNYDVITFLVLDDEGGVVSTVDLMRDQDTFAHRVNSSSSRSTKLNQVLCKYPNTDLIMIYIGAFAEAVIAPDNTVYFLNLSKTEKADVDLYSLLCEENTKLNSALTEEESIFEDDGIYRAGFQSYGELVFIMANIAYEIPKEIFVLEETVPVTLYFGIGSNEFSRLPEDGKFVFSLKAKENEIVCSLGEITLNEMKNGDFSYAVDWRGRITYAHGGDTVSLDSTLFSDGPGCYLITVDFCSEAALEGWYEQNLGYIPENGQLEIDRIELTYSRSSNYYVFGTAS